MIPKPLARFGSVAALLCLVVFSTAVQAADTPGKWVQIFNGKDLNGWTPKFRGSVLGENYKNTFRVEDGLLKVDYSNYTTFAGEFGHLFWREKLSHYRLRVEYRFVGEQVKGAPAWAIRNNGIMIFSQAPETMEINQDFPASIEVQLVGGDGINPRPNAGACTPHTHIVYDGKVTTEHCTVSKAKTYDGEQWVTIEVEAHGGKLIKHIMEGETVITYSQPQLSEDVIALKLAQQGPKLLEEGYICLQAETHGTEFRKIELMKLDE